MPLCYLQAVAKASLQTTCESLITNGSMLLNPCGLIANSFFTGKFAVIVSGRAISTFSLFGSN